jgi:hypothetical protein
MAMLVDRCLISLRRCLVIARFMPARSRWLPSMDVDNRLSRPQEAPCYLSEMFNESVPGSLMMSREDSGATCSERESSL